MTATKKPGSGEDEYIAREEARKAELKRIERDQKEAEAARKARIGTCPRGDATKLVEETFQHIKIDRCPTCGGVWLDPGELEEIASDNASAVRGLFEFLARKKR